MRSADDVAAAVSVSELARRGPGCAGGIERCVEPVRYGGVRQNADSLAVRTASARVRYGSSQGRRERQSALKRQNPVKLPAAHDGVGDRIRDIEFPAFSERQIVNKALGGAVLEIE